MAPAHEAKRESDAQNRCQKGQDEAGGRRCVNGRIQREPHQVGLEAGGDDCRHRTRHEEQSQQDECAVDDPFDRTGKDGA